MKFKRKKICIFATVLLAIILLFPLEFEVDDGGTKGYFAVLYSVMHKHSLDSKEGVDGYSIGTIVRLLFWEIYNDVTFFSYEDISKQ